MYLNACMEVMKKINKEINDQIFFAPNNDPYDISPEDMAEDEL